MLQRRGSAWAPQIMAVLAAVLMLPTAGTAWAQSDSFDDDDGSVYEGAINALHSEGIVAGCDAATDRFCPDQSIRRDQLASLLVRAHDLPPTSQDFFDDDDGNAHEDNINALRAAGITQGCDGSGGYCPGETVHRNQMASLLVRSIELPSTKRDFFDDVAGTHAYPVNKIAAAGITGGCNDAQTKYCPRDPVLRGQMALFLARGLGLASRVEMPDPTPPAETQPKTASAEKIPWGVWDRLAECESSGNWSINTGNGYYGGLQFSLSSWRAVGGRGYPHWHPREEQIRRGELLQAKQGWGAWPACSRKLGLR